MRRKLAFLLALLPLLGGCGEKHPFGNVREIDQLSLAQTLGVDYRGGLCTVTVSAAEEGHALLKARAVTLSRAVREMQNYTEKRYIFYGHTRHLLLGPEAARDFFGECLEFVERDGELRMDTKLYVVRSSSAEDAVACPGGGEGSVGEALDSLEKDVSLLSESHVFTCAETAEALAERGCALVSALRLAEPDNILAGEDRRTLLSAGFAVIAEGTLAGWLDPDLARGANLLMEQPGGDLIEAPDGQGGWFAAALTGSSASWLPQFAEGELTGLTLRLELRCSLSELQQPLDLRKGETIRKMEEGIASVEAWRVSEVLRISQEMGADFCGLEKAVRRAAPLRFDRMKTPWRECFPALPVRLEISVKLTRTYEGEIEPLGSGERRAG